MITKQILSNLLFTYDPAHTHCVFYKQVNEYDKESSEIVSLLDMGVPFKLAFYSVMSHWFWDDWVDVSTFQFIELEYYQHNV
jgi:hypothetical protein